jgi:Fic family protein
MGIEFIKQHGSIANADYQKIAGVSSRTALRDLKDLKLKGIVVSNAETGRGQEYRLNTTNAP